MARPSSTESGLARGHEKTVLLLGNVNVGKTTLFNHLCGKRLKVANYPGTSVSVGRGTFSEAGVNYRLIDTPGIDELDGEERERLARSISRRSDVTLMICEGDLTESEFESLRQLCSAQRTALLVLNKSDRYTGDELGLLLGRLRQRCRDLLAPDQVVSASADPRQETVIHVDPSGAERETSRQPPPDIAQLRDRLWSLLEKEGQTLAALNAAIFASELDEKVATRIVTARKTVADGIIRKYCLAKGVLVALNPVTPLLVTVRELATAGMVSSPSAFWLASAFTLVCLFVAWVGFRVAMPFMIERWSS